jgi:hypothetical protein
VANRDTKNHALACLFVDLHFVCSMVANKFVVFLAHFSSLSFHLSSLTSSTNALSNAFFLGLLSIHQRSQHESESDPLMAHCP